jgi:hypothetical protein
MCVSPANRRLVGPILMLGVLLSGMSSQGRAEEAAAAEKIAVRALREHLPDLESHTRLEAASPLANAYALLLPRDRPLEEVKSQIASIAASGPHPAVWRMATEQGRVVERLTESTEGRRFRTRGVQRMQAEVLARARTVLRLAGMSDKQLEKIRDDEPRMAASAGKLRPFYSLLSEMPTLAIQRVISGEPIELTYFDLTPIQQAVVRDAVKGGGSSRGRRLPDGAVEIIESFNGLKDYPRCRIVLRLSGSPEKPGMDVAIWTKATSSQSLNLLNPGVGPPEERPKWLNKALDAKEPKPPTRRKAIDPSDPALHQTVVIKSRVTSSFSIPGAEGPRPASSADCLRQLSEQTRLPLAAQYDPGYWDYFYRNMPKSLGQDLKDMPASEALDRICERWGLQWEKVGGWIRVYNPRWIYGLSGVVDLSPPWVGEPWRPSFAATGDDPDRVLSDPRDVRR